MNTPIEYLGNEEEKKYKTKNKIKKRLLKPLLFLLINHNSRIQNRNANHSSRACLSLYKTKKI